MERTLGEAVAKAFLSALHKGEGSQSGSRRSVRPLSFFEIDAGRPQPPARLLRLRSDRHTPEARLAGSNSGPNLSMPQRTTLVSADLIAAAGQGRRCAGVRKQKRSRGWNQRFNPRARCRSTGTCLKLRSTGYLPPSALQSGVVRDGRPIARKASGVMPSVWVTLSTRPTILFDSVPSAFAVTSLTKTEPVA
jgi:hypothetical protein